MLQSISASGHSEHLPASCLLQDQTFRSDLCVQAAEWRTHLELEELGELGLHFPGVGPAPPVPRQVVRVGGHL